MDDDILRLRQLAVSLAQSEERESFIKGAELLKLVSEIENQRVDTKQIEDKLLESRAERKTRTIKDLVTILAPLLTTLVLAGTLLVQSHQFSQSELDKNVEAQRQRDAAEDANWSDALKLLKGSENLSPSVVLLKRFSKSSRYAAEARLIAIRLLSLKLDDADAFRTLFESVLVPLTWESISDVLDIDRQVSQARAATYDRRPLGQKDEEVQKKRCGI